MKKMISNKKHKNNMDSDNIASGGKIASCNKNIWLLFNAVKGGNSIAGKIKSGFVRIAVIITDLIYPPVCGFCGKRLYPGVRVRVCDECANTLPYCLKYARCEECGKPLNDGCGCGDCIGKRNYFKKATAPFLYTDKVKSAIVAFKKENGAERADVLSVYVAQMVKHDFKDVSFDCVVSVPPRKKSATEEKFDQAAYLGIKTAKRLGLPYIRFSMKQIKAVTKQSTLSKEARSENIKGVFRVQRPRAVKDKTILLVDDVCTTGATLNECARILKESGAYCVYAVTAATVIAQ